MRVFTAVITEILKNWEVRFKVNNIADQMSVFPKASYVGPKTKELEVDQEILVIHPTVQNHEFLFLKLEEDEDVKLIHKKNVIDITEENTISMKNDNGSFLINKSNLEAKFKDNTTIKMEVAGVTIKHQGKSLKLDAMGVTSSNKMTITNAVIDGFCALPNCLFTGAPHTKNSAGL